MQNAAIVTGGSRGIGAEVARTLARAGYKTVINYKNSMEKAEAICAELTAEGFEAVPFRADVSNGEEAAALVEFAVRKYGTLDLLVNNAGISDVGLITDVTDERWRDIVGTNLSGTFYCCREAARVMVKNHSGAIVNISSMWGITGASCECAYSATKAGVIGLTKSLAKELGMSGIRVNCIAPGVIDTEMNRHLTDDDMAALEDETPLGRIGTPADVADAVLFLASERASFITGQTISVDGGFVI